MLYFINSATPGMSSIEALHDYIAIFLLGTLVTVLMTLLVVFVYFSKSPSDLKGFQLLSSNFFSKFYYKKYMGDGVGIVSFRKDRGSVVYDKLEHNSVLETIWTIVPVVILLYIAVPSFSLLYMMDEVLSPKITIKAIGNQWYWSYEYQEYMGDVKSFDSYMLSDDDLSVGDLRLLEVDNPVVVPVKTPIRILITSRDVLHCWTVPALGVKVDAVPGRLNQLTTYITRTGYFYGQCSELCGVNHGFMPIVVSVVSNDYYFKWLDLLD